MAGVAYQLVGDAEHFPKQVGVEYGTVFAVVFGIEKGLFKEIWLFKTVEILVSGIFEAFLYELQKRVDCGLFIFS